MIANQVEVRIFKIGARTNLLSRPFLHSLHHGDTLLVQIAFDSLTLVDFCSSLGWLESQWTDTTALWRLLLQIRLCLAHLITTVLQAVDVEACGRSAKLICPCLHVASVDLCW